MADVANSYLENSPGRYYVDNQCIDCDLCRQTAPSNFARDEQRGHSFVFRQPRTLEEETMCREAMQNCPVEAIGDDGEVVKRATWNRQLVKNTRQGVGAQKIPLVPPLTPAGLGSSLNFGGYR